MKRTFRNWGNTVVCRPQIHYPTSLEAIQDIVLQAVAQQRTLRVVGSGHSWTPLVETNDWLISLDKFQGIEQVDTEQKTALVRAGTKLKALGEALAAHGLAMENLGDIDVQSIAGALNTGTHGTGKAFGTLATQIETITLVDGRGEVQTCSATQNAELFKAAQISLGALGIITHYTLRLVSAYKLHFQAQKATTEELFQNVAHYLSTYRNFEFYYFLHTNTIQLKLANTTDAPIRNGGWWKKFNDLVVENGLFWLMSHAVRLMPRLAIPVSKLSAAAVPLGDYVDQSHRIYATQRLVRFYEMEYNLPVEHFKAAFQEVLACVEREKFKVHMPIECRWVKADDILISPASGRDSVYLAFHVFKGMPYRAYFEAMEAIMRRFGGRPHYGKMNTLRYAEFQQIYPDWEKFVTIQKQQDPQGIFLNNYLRRIFQEEIPNQAIKTHTASLTPSIS